MAIALGNIYIPDFQLFVPEIAVYNSSSVILSNYDDLCARLRQYNSEQGTSYEMTDFEVGIISKAPRRRHPKRCYNSNGTDIAYKLGASGYKSIHRNWWRFPQNTNGKHRPKCYTISWRHINYIGSDFNFTLKNNIIDDLYEYAVKRNTAGYGPASSYCGNLLYTHAANYSAVHAITYLGVIFRLKTPSGYLETDMSKTTIACIPASSAWISDEMVKVGPTWGWADCLDVARDSSVKPKLW